MFGVLYFVNCQNKEPASWNIISDGSSDQTKTPFFLCGKFFLVSASPPLGVRLFGRFARVEFSSIKPLRDEELLPLRAQGVEIP